MGSVNRLTVQSSSYVMRSGFQGKGQVGVNSKKNDESKEYQNRPVRSSMKVSQPEACILVGGQRKWEENVVDRLLLWHLNRLSPKWCKSLMRLAIFRLYLSFKRNVTGNLLISSLKRALPQAVNGKNASMLIPYFKIYLFFIQTTLTTFLLHTQQHSRHSVEHNIKILYPCLSGACFLIKSVRNVYNLPQICRFWKKSSFSTKVNFKIFSLQPMGIVNVS